MKKNWFEKGTVIVWTNDGEILEFEDERTAFKELEIYADEGYKFPEFVNRLGTDIEITSGATAFRYGVDLEATKGYDEAMAEVEKYNKEQE